MLGTLSSFQRRLLSWYDRCRRDLPWRICPRPGSASLPDSYHVLVSETMLQQTQVATVVPYFLRFIRRFPTLQSLASASSREVLRLWQGLGYYSRAARLMRTAKIVVDQYDGRLPSQVDDLLKLPGIGRYTAGAIASLAFDQRAPILDGNVTRVLCRLDCITLDPCSQPAVRESLWKRAEQILPQRRLGDFNSALMELGATICTPRSPRCDQCPVHKHCQARTTGNPAAIPPAAKTKARPLERRWTLCIRHKDRWLIEQRPDQGRWAGMWQFVTLPAEEDPITPDLVKMRMGLHVKSMRHAGTVQHDLTHRRYHFDVYRCELAGPPAKHGSTRRWVELADLPRYPLPRPHLRIAKSLQGPIT